MCLIKIIYAIMSVIILNVAMFEHYLYRPANWMRFPVFRKSLMIRL